eukprot:6361851-Amphidinium_carterae.2
MTSTCCHNSPRSPTSSLGLGKLVKVPDSDSDDPLLKCIVELVQQEKLKALSFGRFCELVRVSVSMWVCSARKHGYAIAGLSVYDIAEFASVLGLEVEQVPDRIAFAMLPKDGAVYLAYAIACLLQLIKVCVIDETGQSADGFVYPNGLGLYCHCGRWVAFRLSSFPPRTFFHEVSTTLALDALASDDPCTIH